jgi:hypothetical protein
MKEITGIKPLAPYEYARDEIGFLMFASGIYSQGFEIIEIDYQKDGDALMILKDMTNGDPLSRGIHASQLTYTLWFIAESNTSTVEFRTTDNITFLKATTTRDVCDKIKSGEKRLTYLAETLKFEIIKNGG